MGVGLDMIGGRTASTAHMRDTSVMTTIATPQVGSIRYNKRVGGGHVGLVVAVNGNQVTTIEGNTGNGVVAYRTHTVGDGGIFRMPSYGSHDVNSVIGVAKGQLGYRESSGNSTPFGQFTGCDGQAWCASFLSWCFDRAYAGGGAYEAYGNGTGEVPAGGWDSQGNYVGPGTGLGIGMGGLEFHGHIWGNSSLVRYYSRLSNGAYFNRENRASHVTVHNAFSECDIMTLASMVNSSGKGYNYGVDASGVIGLFVDEQLWTNSSDSWEADSFGINIICSGTHGGISAGALSALTDLLEDVFRRNFLYLVTFHDNIDDTLTLHRQYNTEVDCPGAAAETQLRIIADEVNNRLSAKIQTNFVQVGSRLAMSKTAALRTQSLINIKQINPYVVKFKNSYNPKKIDIDMLWLCGVIGAFVDIGSYSEKQKFNTDDVYDICDALMEDGKYMPYGFTFKSRAATVADVREEAYWLHFIIVKYPPKFGLWIEPDFKNTKLAPTLLQEWYEFFVDWGLKSKCGIYADREQADNIGWPAQSNYMALWLAGEMTDAVCPDEELLTPTFFKLNDLSNYGINVDEQAYWKSAQLGFDVFSNTTSPFSSGTATYDGELKIIQNSDGSTTVVIPEVTDHAIAKKWESYTAITNQSTINYQLTHSAKTTTDELGFRKYDGRYLIAVGSGVCKQTGTYMDVILKDGTKIPCIMGDGKADVHTDSSNIYTNVNSTYCCSEFIMDKNAKSWSGGDCSKVNGWGSPVEKIVVYNKRVTSA